MFKRLSISLILFSVSLCYGQNVTLLKNYNPKVKELKHNLNQTKDSLWLNCETIINKVDIFNDDYDQTFEIKDTRALISLHELPKGKFVVEVQLTDKIVEMHVIKYADLTKDTIESLKTKNVIEGNGMMLDEEMNIIKSPPKNSIEFLLTGSKGKKSKNKRQKFYWVALEVNNGNNSYKSMKLLSESVVLKMISKNKLEAKTNFGRRNKLTVWEVYDTSKFMQKQVANPDYINVSASNLFNVEPYYSSSKNAAPETI